MLRIYQNARVVAAGRVQDLCVLAENGRILSLCARTDAPGEHIDCGGLFLAPGFADLHVHGGGGYSAMSDAPADIRRMALAHAAHGVTSIVPTTLAAPIARLKKSIGVIREAKRTSPDLNILGVHLEGPFLSPEKCGAQSPGNILPPTPENVEALLGDPADILMVGAAPELPGAFALGEYAAARGITVSAAHSNADFSVCEQALDHGFSDVTHIFSACSAMHKEGIYRKVGLAEAGLALPGYTVQFIGDLRHLPYGALKLIFAAKGAAKAYPVSDGLEFCACDMPDGSLVEQENGQKAIIANGVMMLADRSCLAGSVTPLDKMVANLVRVCGVPLPEAVRMASRTPLSVVGLSDSKGEIAPGYDEDLILFDEEIRVQRVVIRGKRLK